jgi:hypothetical protein
MKKIRKPIKCLCGCGYFIPSRDNQIIAPHHDRNERCKIRHQVARRKACEGMLGVFEWRLCAVCEEWFPIFKEVYGKDPAIATCPQFINPECSVIHRNTRRLEKKEVEDDCWDNEQEKAFRSYLCHKPQGRCAQYVSCSDREYNDTPEERRWEHELHGLDCYKRPRNKIKIWGSSILGATHGGHIPSTALTSAGSMEDE